MRRDRDRRHVTNVAIDDLREPLERIREGHDYEGVRVRFQATVAKARVPMQIDIGFGDVITPGPAKVEYPGLLDLPAPVLMAYPRETVVAEKLEALTVLGLLNSRMKDYFDLGLLARTYPFDGQILVAAISATFTRRGTGIEAEPIGLSHAFATRSGAGNSVAIIPSQEPLSRPARSLASVVEQK